MRLYNNIISDANDTDELVNSVVSIAYVHEAFLSQLRSQESGSSTRT